MIKKITLLYGGPSGEHEISLRSAASVLKNLDHHRYEVTLVGIDKTGACFQNTSADLLPMLTSETAMLPVKGAHAKSLPSLLSHGKFAIETDVVFPMVHGPLFEDGALQGLLELADIAYVGSNILPSAIGMDKDISRRVLKLDGVTSTRYKTLSLYVSDEARALFCQTVIEEFGFPLFVKPCCMGSSVGVQKVTQASALDAALTHAFLFDETVMVEQGIIGRELEIAVLEHDDPHHPPIVSLPGELKVNHPDGFYSYTAKYIDSEKTELCIPADLSSSLSQQLQTLARTIFTRLKCKGMARIDFFLHAETQAIYFNEINTLPGFTSISMYPRLMAASGISYPQLLDHLIHLAYAHYQRRKQLSRDYQ